MGKSNTATKQENKKKWCFAIVLNRAYDNYIHNSNLFSESLLRYEKNNRRDWFDEGTRAMIDTVNEQANKTKDSKPDTVIEKKLRNIRNFYSHFHHKDYPLKFTKDEPLRIILEAAYKKAVEHIFGRQSSISELNKKELFNEKDMITDDGVLFFASFFVERSILRRLMGCIGGYTETEGKYKLTHDIFTTYCLRDSYSIGAQDSKAVLFRDIMGYLMHVPSEYYETYLSNYNTNNTKKKEDKEPIKGQRKKSKFVIFALKYLDEFVNSELKELTVDIGHSQIERIEKESKQGKDENYKPHTTTKVKVWFRDRNNSDKRYYHYSNAKGEEYKIKIDQENQEKLDYYLHRDTAILRIGKQGADTYYCKIGPDDLRYLVLLCLQDRSKDAYDEIYNYLEEMKEPEKVLEKGENSSFYKGLPQFVLKKAGVPQKDKQEQLKDRLKYITDKWNKKKSESEEATLNSKSRDILRYIKWHITRELSTPEYNRLFELLVVKDFTGFRKQLERLKDTERITETTFNMLGGFDDLNKMHMKVCDSVLAELEELERTDTEKLLEHVGIVRQPAPENSQPPNYKRKVKIFTDMPTIYKGFLRNTFFIDKSIPKGQKQMSFAKLVETELDKKYQDSDVPLGSDHYYIHSLERFDKANSALYETLALDRMCLMIARECYEKINKNLHEHGQEIRWTKEGKDEFIYIKITYDPSVPDKTNSKQNRNASGDCLNIPALNEKPFKFTIRFDKNHYTKLYVMDNHYFFGGLIQFFFIDKINAPIDYHDLYRDGINNFTQLQREGIQAIFELEGKIIDEKHLSTEKEKILFPKIMANSDFSDDEQKKMTNVRNGLQHYSIGVKPKDKGNGYYEFTPEDLKIFINVMAKTGLRRKNHWTEKVKNIEVALRT